MMHEKLLSDIERVVEKRVVPTSSSPSTPTLDNTEADPFSSIPSAYSAGLLPSTKSIDKKDIFDLVFDSPSLRMDEELKIPAKLDETTLMSDVTQNLVDVFSSSSMLSSPKKHNHPPPLPPRNNSSSDVKVLEPLQITRAPTGFGGFKPSKESSPKIRFAGTSLTHTHTHTSTQSLLTITVPNSSTLGRETSSTSTLTLTTSYGNTRLTQEEEEEHGRM